MRESDDDYESDGSEDPPMTEDAMSDGSFGDVEEAMLLDLENDRDVDYDRGDLMREADSDGESMGDCISECADSEGCYEDEEARLHAMLGEGSVPMSESAGMRALFPCL